MVASFNQLTYPGVSEAEFTSESARASLSFLLEPDGDFPDAPTTAEVNDKARELIGWTGLDETDGYVQRNLPMSHPVHGNLVAVNVKVYPVPDQSTFSNEIADPVPDREAEAAHGDAVAWERWRYDVTFAPRPFAMIADGLIHRTDSTWFDENGSPVGYSYYPEWDRYTDEVITPREEYVRAKFGWMRFRTLDASPPDGNPYPANRALLLPDETLTVTWFQVPYRFITSPASHLRRFRNYVNQFAWKEYPPGAVLYRGFKPRRYTPPFTEMDPAYGGIGVYAADKLVDIDLEFHVTYRTAASAPPAMANPNWIPAGHNLLPWYKTNRFYYASVNNDTPSTPGDPFAQFPMFSSFPVELLFNDPGLWSVNESRLDAMEFELIFPVKVTEVATGEDGQWDYTAVEVQIIDGEYVEVDGGRYFGEAGRAPLRDLNNVQHTSFPFFAWARFRDMGGDGKPYFEFLHPSVLNLTDVTVDLNNVIVNWTDVDWTLTSVDITIHNGVTVEGDFWIFNNPLKIFDGLWWHYNTITLSGSPVVDLSLRNVALKDRVVARLDASGFTEIGSMIRIADSGSGQAVVLTNVGSGDIVLLHQAAVGTPAYRFVCPNFVDFLLLPGEGALCWYDPAAMSTVGAWLVIARDFYWEDEKFKITSGDTAEGYAEDKITSNDGSVTLTVVDTGAGVEVLDLSVTDEFVKVTNTDNDGGYLFDKLASSDASVLFNVVSVFGDEVLDLSAPKVSVSGNDTTPDYLIAKLVAGTNITLTENNDGGNETITIAAGGGGGSGTPGWVKVTKSHTDFQAASTNNTINIYTLPPKGVLHEVVIKHTAQFTGPGLFSYSVSLEHDGQVVISGFSVFGAPSDTSRVHEKEETSHCTIRTFAGAAIDVEAISTGANLSVSTAGSVDFYLLISTLP